MGNIGACTQCGRPGVFQMHTPRKPYIHYIPSEFLEPETGWVTVCPKCEVVLGDINLKQAGYKRTPQKIRGVKMRQHTAKWVKPSPGPGRGTENKVRYL